MPQPAVGMAPLRIVMRPVDHAALRIGGEFAVELDGVAFADPADARREVDIVRDEQSPAARDSQDETLVPAAVIVVRQDAHHGTGAAHLATVAVLAAGLCRAGNDWRCFRQPLLD